MTRLDDLLSRVPADLRDDLTAEIARRARPQRHFGLVFERHDPEAVDLVGMQPAPGDTAHVLPPRGSGDDRDLTLWRVDAVDTDNTAHLTEVLPGGTAWDADVMGRAPATITADAGDIVPVAESTDTIYPGLELVDRVQGGDTNDAVHTIIDGENLHALEALTYTHAGRVDCIYIDPPYNTGAKDWKYNNDYVDGRDAYRHSKWLTFMERRLQMAKKLLNPDDSVLIVTIDEKEYLRLGMLLEQTFPGARIQMVSSVIKPGGVARGNEFARSDEFLFFVFIGSGCPKPSIQGDEWGSNKSDSGARSDVYWAQLYRRGTNGTREHSPGCYYPIYVSKLSDGSTRVEGVGDVLGPEDSVNKDPVDGVYPVYPPFRTVDRKQGRWSVTPDGAKELFSKGYIKAGKFKGSETPLYFLQKGQRQKIESGDYVVDGIGPDNTAIVRTAGAYTASSVPTTSWEVASHDASRHGSGLTTKLLGERRFTYPKSLYAVEDALRFFVKDKPDATVLDFFAGSGTTAHAVMRLNQEDGGRRRSISVTNNEVSEDEAKALTKRGLRPGDAEWDELGIANHVTFPRVKAAVTGKTDKSGYETPIKGKYAYNREADMADGIPANAVLFRLTYENPMLVEYDMAFDRIAPLLWLRAGQRGVMLTSAEAMRGWAMTPFYGVLTDTSMSKRFIAELKRQGPPLVYVVTDSDSMYQTVARQVPRGTEVVRLYESYLVNFRINDVAVE